MLLRAVVLFLVCDALSAAPAPHLSEDQVIRIADKAARAALHRQFSAFRRAAAYFDVHHAQWSIWYKNSKTPSSEFCVRVSDTTKETQMPKNMLRLDINTSNQSMKPTN